MSVCAILATWKLTKLQVTPTQKFILLSYADRAGESFECWPSNSRLEKDTGYDRHTICQNKQQLIEKGLISYTGEKKGRTKSIDVIRLNYVTPREGYEPEVDYRSSVEMPTAKDSSNLVSSVEMPTAKQCGNAHTEPTILEPTKKLRSIPDSSNTGSSKSLRDYEKDARFMRFYSEYPKKEDPRDAWKAFKSIVGADDELLDQIITDIKHRKEKHSQWQDRQFIKHPAVYLRKGEYLGEIFNAETEMVNKKQKDAADNEARVAKQEQISKQRAEEELKNNLQKQSDAIAYRNAVKQAPSKAMEDALKGMMSHLRR